MENNTIQGNGNANIDFDEIHSKLRRREYKYMGVGSGRVVFDLGNQYVVKVAKNKKGIAQNKAEHDIALDENSDLFAKILCVSPGYRYLVMEKAATLNMPYVWKYFKVRNNRELYNLKEIQDISTKYGLLIRDFGRRVNWGKINERPVIIDYGFTKEVYKKYYKF